MTREVRGVQHLHEFGKRLLTPSFHGNDELYNAGGEEETHGDGDDDFADALE